MNADEARELLRLQEQRGRIDQEIAEYRGWIGKSKLNTTSFEITEIKENSSWGRNPTLTLRPNYADIKRILTERIRELERSRVELVLKLNAFEKR